MDVPRRMTRVIRFRVTKDQLISLQNKAEYHGFATISQYCRFVMLHDFDMENRIKRIYEKVVGDK
jgi:hypothetical protein